ncbi:hypothetical protein HDU93_001678 [Gonapodya sp. JEL0774]|nr:hypothetical protein HDU93_001678 [Gonapodya sp. JEL0774]
MVVDLVFPSKVEVTESGKTPKASNGEDPLNLSDVLQVNELFKYYRLPFLAHPKFGYSDLLSDCRYDWRKNACIGKLTLDESNSPPTSRAAYADYISRAYLGRWDWMLECPLVHPVTKQNLHIMPQLWITRARDYEVSLASSNSPGKTLDTSHPADPADPTPSESTRGWLSYPDNRAFVWTAVMASSQHLTNSSNGNDSGHWVRLLNVDLPSSSSPCGPTPFELSWVDPITYRRWTHFGSQYGFSYHSGAFWTTPDNHSFVDIFFGVYFDLALVLLYSRVVLMRFNLDLALLAPAPGMRKMTPVSPTSALATSKRGRSLRGDLRTFTQIFLPPSLSIQQQGYELSSLFRAAMEIDRFYDHLMTKVNAIARLEMREDTEATHCWYISRNGDGDVCMGLWYFVGALTLGALAVRLTVFKGIH